MLRTLITQRQAGNVAGSVSFLMRTPDEELDKQQALKLHLECDLGDLILQAEMLAKDLGFNVDKMKLQAYDRYDECKNEFKTKGKSQYFI